LLALRTDPADPGQYRVIEGGTLEAIGAIHFASADTRSGKKGIKATQLYLELQVHGDKKREQVEALGIRPGDSILLNRPIRRGFSDDTFYGAYLDNGLGCFVTAEVARVIVEAGGLENVRLLAAIATHEEIGRMGSRVLAGEFAPDVLIGIDVSHDWTAAPSNSEERFAPVSMGAGMTLAVGSIANAYLNSLYQRVCKDMGIPLQIKLVGRDTGTDAMAGVFAAIDAAATSIGFPIRNMHTISECGHTGDVLSAIHATAGLLHHLDGLNGTGATAEDFKGNHPRLDRSRPLSKS
jgi:endoglucanase